MALQQPYTDDESDQTYPNAYWRVKRLLQDWELRNGALNPVGEIGVVVFVSAGTAGNAAKRPVALKTYYLGEQATRMIFGMQQPTPSAVIPTNRAYAYLKTLPEFAGAVDV